MKCCEIYLKFTLNEYILISIRRLIEQIVDKGVELS